VFELELEAITLAERSLIRKALVSEEVVIAAPVTRSKLVYFELASFSSDNIVTLTAKGEDFASYTESLEADSIPQEDMVWRIVFSVYLPRFQAVAINRKVVFESNESNRLTAMIAGHADTLEKFPGAVIKTLEVRDIRKPVDPMWEGVLVPITIGPDIPHWIRNTSTGTTFVADGGAGPYTFAVTAGTFPSGLTLQSSGVVTGSPSSSGTATFTITATDSNNAQGERAYSVPVMSPP